MGPLGSGWGAGRPEAMNWPTKNPSPAARHALHEAPATVDSEELPGEAPLLVVIENVWAIGLADALRDAGVVFAQQNYPPPRGLVALGEMLALDVEVGG